MLDRQYDVRVKATIWPGRTFHCVEFGDIAAILREITACC